MEGERAHGAPQRPRSQRAGAARDERTRKRVSGAKRARPLRLRVAGGAAVLLVVCALAALGWREHRQAGVPEGLAAGSPVPTDEREARLLGAVRAHPDDPRAHRELGAYYLESQRPFEALWELSVARERGEDSVGLILRMAEALQQAALPEAALRLLTEACRRHPEQPSLRVALARTEVGLAEPEAALEALRRYPDLNPRPRGGSLSPGEPLASPEGLLVLAMTHVALGDMPAARAAARRCRDLTRTDRAGTPRADLDLYLGRLALACGDREEARKELTAAARERPGDEETEYYSGLVCAAGSAPRDREAAIGHYQLAAQADPRQTRAALALGRLRDEESGQWKQAADTYRAVLAMDPSNAEAEDGLARAASALGEPGEALYHRARSRQLKDRPDEAIRLYRRWGQRGTSARGQPEHWDSVLRCAECWMDMGRYLDAAREVQRGLQRYPENPELMGALAQIYLHTGNGPAALPLCERWARLDRSSGRPEWVRGLLADKALRSDEAIRWFEAAIRKDPRNGVYHGALGEALSGAPAPERLRRARAELAQATSLEPGAALFHSELGQVLQRLGDPESARQAFLRAIDRDSSDPEAYRGVMSVARRLRRPGTAELFSRIERGVRDCRREEQAARRVLSEHPSDGRAHLAVARALLRRGKLAEAKEHLTIAAEQPGGAEARSLLRRVDRLLSVL